jgi:hypothetical protein
MRDQRPVERRTDQENICEARLDLPAGSDMQLTSYAGFFEPGEDVV